MPSAPTKQEPNKLLIKDIFDKCIEAIPLKTDRQLGLFISGQTYKRYLTETGKKKARTYKGFKIIVCGIQNDRVLFSDAN